MLVFGDTQQVFPYEYLNRVQSECFEVLMHSDNNFVLSGTRRSILLFFESEIEVDDPNNRQPCHSTNRVAPTGAGKTVAFELALVRLFQFHARDYGGTCKAVYIAPLKVRIYEFRLAPRARR